VEIIVRKATPADVSVIADFNLALAWETEHLRLDEPRVLAGVKALIREPARGTYYLAEAVSRSGAREIAGQLLITYEWSDWRNGNFWWLQSVFVAEAARKSGVFRTLFDHVQMEARSTADVCGLRLYMDGNNSKARQAYERLGMTFTNYQIFEMDFVLRSHQESPKDHS
jgi:GNAT superfamily N-acetyltransferase